MTYFLDMKTFKNIAASVAISVILLDCLCLTVTGQLYCEFIDGIYSYLLYLFVFIKIKFSKYHILYRRGRDGLIYFNSFLF